YGMSGLTLYRRVVGPLALRQALPAYGNELILMVKATALASTVTLMELTGLAHKLISESFRAVEVFLVAGAIYLFVNFILTQIVSFGERVIAPDLAIRPVSARSVVVH
ncbi:MAG: ABC transporter permease, partial [Beijerinckiaceae bacterium]